MAKDKDDDGFGISGEKHPPPAHHVEVPLRPESLALLALQSFIRALKVIQMLLSIMTLS